jgi:uncharacterized protein
MQPIILGRNQSDIKKYGEKATIFLGKHYIQMEREKTLANPVLLDVNRPHVLLISGKRGGGKCLEENTLITLENGKVIPIKELENNKDNILALNSNLKISPSIKNKFYKRVVKELLYIKLRSGKEIKLTPEHPLLTILGWKDAKELGEGDRIATPRILSSFGNKELSEHKIKILAYLIAEGHTKNTYTLFSNMDLKIVTDFKKSVKEFDSNLKVTQDNRGCYRVSQIKKRYKIIKAKRNELGQFLEGSVIYNTPSLRKWLINIGIHDLLSLEKYIPKEIFNLPKYQLALFLNRLFSCDGSIYNTKTRNTRVWEISYSSSSQKLIKQVHHLLLRFNILSKLRTKKIKYLNRVVKSYEIVFNANNVIKFINEIGFYGNKQKLQEQALNETINLNRNPNVDTIPKDIWKLYKPDNWARIGRELNYKIPKSLRESQKYSPSRQKLAQIAIADDKLSLFELATSDIFWDEIVETKIMYGEFTVYDISVPKYHNFIANDIIVHNSYSMGVLAEGLANLPSDLKHNISTVIFDTMGIFWTMKHSNYRDEELLYKWKLKPEKLKPRLFVPFGQVEDYRKKGLPVDFELSLAPHDLEPQDWCNLFGIDFNSNAGILIERTILSIKLKHFSVDEIIKKIKLDKRASKDEKNLVIARYETVEKWDLFSEKGTNFNKIAAGGETSIIDLSAYNFVEDGQQIKALVIAVFCKKILKTRMLARKAEEVLDVKDEIDKMHKKEPLVWIMIDEAHEFLPKEGKTLASEPLIQLLREGRQPGISMILATQQPGKIHTDVMTQSDIVISHRLTAKLDINALNDIMQSYLSSDIQKYIDGLPTVKGSAIALDDNSEKMFAIQIRPRTSWHGGEDPAVIRKSMKLSLKSGLNLNI